MAEDVAPTLQISINAGTAEELVRLYDVGPELAQRILEYRTLHGCFSGPEDLAQVDGVSHRLAVTLSPHIDWDMPSEPEEPSSPNHPLIALGVVLQFSAVAMFAALLWEVLAVTYRVLRSPYDAYVGRLPFRRTDGILEQP